MPQAKKFCLDNENPTPEEIKEREERAAEIRARWSDAEMWRRGGGCKKRCEIRRFVFDGRDDTFSSID
jgi:hypothetical protein